MHIDFSNYKSLTQKDIFSVNESGIECSEGTVSFTECNKNFIENCNTNGNYVGEFDCSGSNPSIVLYTAPYTTHFFFINNDNMFYQMIKTIKDYGYEFLDAKELY